MRVLDECIPCSDEADMLVGGVSSPQHAIDDRAHIFFFWVFAGKVTLQTEWLGTPHRTVTAALVRGRFQLER